MSDLLLRLTLLQNACRKAASAETCYEADVPLWSRDDPLKGHCGAIAFVVALLLGGDMLSGRTESGERHIWSRLPDGAEFDLSQPHLGTIVRHGRVFKPKRPNARFLIFARRVLNIVPSLVNTNSLQ